jgi:ornithine carbamoyltransferase
MSAHSVLAFRESLPPLQRPQGLPGKHLLSVHDLTLGEAEFLLALGLRVKAHPADFQDALKGRTLALLFQKPSLRTRVTFEVGMGQLGGRAIHLGPEEVGLGRREAIKDVARNLSRWVDAIMARVNRHAEVAELAAHSRVPVINGLSDFEHPCQALGDLMTLVEHKGTLSGKTLAWVGDGNNVLHSLLYASTRLGLAMRVATPPEYPPSADVMAAAVFEGGRIMLTNDPREAVEGADAVYTDVWTSMGHEAEAEARRRVFQPYQVNRALMEAAGPQALFMHCLPAHRGEEVTDEVIDSPRSIVYDQAENRLHIQKAILLALLPENS